MNQQELDAARSRTDAKLSYAALHLDELRKIERRGDEFDRAHQESFLFHLVGTRDAFLQELNVYYGCGLALKDVRLKTLKKEMKNTAKRSPALDRLDCLESNPNSWINCAKEMRDYSTHRGGVPRLYHVGGERHGEVFLTDTQSGKPREEDYLKLFEIWLVSMTEMLDELRKLV
jgi:hypothetical protein